MTEKLSSSESIDNNDSQKRGFNTAAKIGGRVCAVIALTEAIWGVRLVYGAPEPTPDKVVEALFRHNGHIYNLVTKTDNCPPPSDPADTAILFDTIVHQTKSPESIAIEYSLNLPDSDRLYDTIPAMHAASTSQEVTALVNTFTKEQMNITIHANHIHEDNGIELSEYKNRVWAFLLTMKEIPRTVIDKLEIRDIVITTEENSSPTSAAEYIPAMKQVSIDYGALDSASVVLHEILGHSAHDAVCSGSAPNDRAFAELNQLEGGYVGNEWKSTQYDPDTFVSRYATSNTVEDYAETTEGYLVGDIQPNLIGEQYPIEKKVSLILMRLNHLVPGSAEYFSSRIADFAANERHYLDRVNREANH